MGIKVKQLVLVFSSFTCIQASAAPTVYDTQYFSRKINGLYPTQPAASATPVTEAPSSPIVDLSRSSEITAQDQVFNEILGACKGTLENFASEAKQQIKRSERWSLWGAAAGLLGSVAAGHVSPVVVGLLSGTSGLANTAQQAYKDNGDTPAVTLENRSAILKNAIAAATEFSQSKDADVRQAALQKLHVSCTLYDITIPKSLPSPAQP